MASVNQTPYNTIPKDWAFDPAIGPFIRNLLDQVRQLRTRTGGDDDATAIVGEIKFLATLPSPLPLGWYLADGTNGTENLIGRFIGAIGNDLAAGANGSAPTNPDTGLAGATTLTMAGAGGHSHTVSVTVPATNIATTGGSLDYGNHAHVLENYVDINNPSSGTTVRVARGGSVITGRNGSNHTHQINSATGNTDLIANHQHTINDVPNHVHATSGNELPPYFGMYVIQYTGQ